MTADGQSVGSRALSTATQIPGLNLISAQDPGRSKTDSVKPRGLILGHKMRVLRDCLRRQERIERIAVMNGMSGERRQTGVCDPDTFKSWIR